MACRELVLTEFFQPRSAAPSSHSTRAPPPRIRAPLACSHGSLRHKSQIAGARKSQSSTLQPSLPPHNARRRSRGPVRAQDGEGGPGEEKPKGEKESGGNTSPEAGGPQKNSGTDSSGALEVLARAVPLPRTVVETLRDQVFGFDSFFVTDQEPYQGGVLFKGNLRLDPSLAYEKINKKLKAKFGDKYLLYLLTSPQDQKPVAVVVPSDELQLPPPAVPDAVGATAFGLVSLLTVLLSNSPSPEFGFLPSAEYLAGPLLEGVPATLVFTLGLISHELGHLFVAQKLNLDLAPPFFIPSTQLGSFGAITRIKSVVKCRSDLVQVASAGPLIGSLVSLFVVVSTLALLHPDPTRDEGIILQASAFQDSFLVGSLAKLILGDRLVSGAEVAVSPLTLAAWSSLLANAINAIPAGELDGGRIALGLFGRQWYTRLSFISLALLGLTGIFNDTALFWVVLIIFLQRGPISPQSDELSPPSDQAKTVGALTLVLCFLVYFPLPFSL